jgi:hypothetical protein
MTTDQAREYIDTLRDTLRSQSPDEPRPSGISVSDPNPTFELRQLRALEQQLTAALKSRERVHEVCNDLFREAVAPVLHLWPEAERPPGVQMICLKLQELHSREKQMREALEKELRKTAEEFAREDPHLDQEEDFDTLVEAYLRPMLAAVAAALALPAAQQPEVGTCSTHCREPHRQEQDCLNWKSQQPAPAAEHPYPHDEILPSPAQEKPVEASVQLFHYGGDNDVRLYAHDDQTKWLYLVRLDDPRHVIPFIDACNKAVNRALATASAPPAAAQETSEKERLDWIIDNCTRNGGGNGFELKIFVPVDSECIRGAIDEVLSRARK